MKIKIIIVLLIAWQSATAQIKFQYLYTSAKDMEINSICPTFDRGYLLAGIIRNSQSNLRDYQLVKIDSFGNIEWQQIYGGAGWDVPNHVIQTSDSGYAVCGYSSNLGPNNSYYDFSFLKTDASGNIQWAKVLHRTYNNELAMSIEQTFDGGYIVCGQNGWSEPNSYLIKLNALGDTMWTKEHSSSVNDEIISYNTKQTSDSGYITTGVYNQNNSTIKAFLLKSDSIGNILWSKSYLIGLHTQSSNVFELPDKGFVFGGFMEDLNNIYGCGYIRTDSLGNVVSKKFYNIPVANFSIAKNKGYLLGGTDAFNAIVLLADSLGNLKWCKSYGDALYQEVFKIIPANDNGILIGGNSQYLNINNPSAGYLIKTDSLGNSGCNTTNQTVTVSSPSVLVDTAVITITNASLTPSIPVSFNGTLTGNPLSKYVICTSTGFASNSPNDNNYFTILPNPSTGIFSVFFKNNYVTGTIEVYSSLGEKILKKEVTNMEKSEIDLSYYANGIYYLKFIDGKSIVSQKIIIGHE